VTLDDRLATARHGGVLNLSNMGLDVVPREVFELSRIKTLDLRENNLLDLPKRIGELVGLENLLLEGNLISSLPESFHKLVNLKHLDLSKNKIVDVDLSQLRILEVVNLGSNPIVDLPTRIELLPRLKTLYMNDCTLRELSPRIERLGTLENLDISGNEITKLPVGIAHMLVRGMLLRLNGNPLSDPLPDLVERGPVALATYLRNLRDGVAQYEAKLLLIGEGNVGKTSLVGAMCDEPFRVNRPTTHGIEIKSIQLAHPRDNIDLTIRSWDFGGQEVYRITHQFFFSNRSLYLVVWNPREGQEQNEVEGWLRRIFLRVGDGARVLIVATHCDERRPELDYPDLLRKFPLSLAGQYAVDSSSRRGIVDLRDAIAHEVAGLPQMGQLLPLEWAAARDDIIKIAETEPQISFRRFVAICRNRRMSDDEIETLAELMHDLGHIIYYAEDDSLRDIVVLNPEWLTKAIGYVLEDGQTRHNGGIIEHERLASIWQSAPDRSGYDHRYHPFFLRLMEKFDVSYRLADGDRSLVAQLVPFERPPLPWQRYSAVFNDDLTYRGIRSLRLTCIMSDVAPGIVAWLTVRHHRSSTTLHWRRGVFLRHPIAVYASEALIELKTDQELTLEVRAPSPDLYFNVLRDSIEDLLRRRWPGLRYELQVPCPTVQDSVPCSGMFPLDGLMALRERDRNEHDCLKCQTTHDVGRLLTGFSTQTEPLKPLLDRLEKKVDKVGRNIADAAHSIRRVLIAISTEVNDCPRLFTIVPDSGWFEYLRIASTGYRLTLWCEFPGNLHECSDATYSIRRRRDWFRAISPYAALVVRTLKIATPIVKDVMGIRLDQKSFSDVQHELDLMKTLVDKVADVSAVDMHRGFGGGTDLNLNYLEGAGLREFRTFLVDTDRMRNFGGLRRVTDSSGDYLWVCPDHYREYDPGLPRLPR
jgi:internalin A